jgi:hypothetical protein
MAFPARLWQGGAMTCRPLALAACLATGLAVPLAGPAVAEPGSGLERFDRFVRSTAPHCAQRAATWCFEQAFAFADRTGDGRLGLDDLERLRDQLEGWARHNGEHLAMEERAAIQLGLWMVQLVGLERLLDSYDADGDGHLTRDELLADVTLDERPLTELLRDPGAVDYAAIGQRLGAAAMLLDRVQGMIVGD